jgi:hypothetical protein
VSDTSTQPADEGVWARLRRRKLVQWSVAYVAGAWGLQQGLAYVSTLLDWPVQVQRLTGLALLNALPIALVLAWYHGDRGQRQVTRTELAVLTLLFLLGGGIFWYFQRAKRRHRQSPIPLHRARLCSRPMQGYAHVHHLRPLSEARGSVTTRLEDLAIVCANCHAIIHRDGACRPLDGLIQRTKGASGSTAPSPEGSQ